MTLGLSLVLSSAARAHEVLPTIADLSVDESTVTLSLLVNLEALLAGIDLDAVEDTDDAAGAADYDALRALSDDEIAARAPVLLEKWNGLPVLSGNGNAVLLSTKSLTVMPQSNTDLARQAEWALLGAIPEGTTSVVVAWPDGSGDLVVRQQGVDAPYTGLIGGGDSSAPIDIGGGNEQDGWQAFMSYVPVGFDHILPKGLDHILFVLGLFLLSMDLRPLLWQVSAFTLAHTVTLALGAMGLVRLPGSIVESRSSPRRSSMSRSKTSLRRG